MAPAISKRQLQKAWRRLLLQRLLDSLISGWGVGLMMVAGWFFLDACLGAQAGFWKWPVAGALMGLATLGSLVQAWRGAPSRVEAALALDKRFGLKERLTSLVTLDPTQEGCPAGLALAADVHKHLAGLNVGRQFPLRLPRSRALLSLAAAVLAGIAFLVPPFGSSPGSDAGVALAQNKDLKKQLEELKKVSLPRHEGEVPKALKDLEDAWEKVVRKAPPKNEEEVRERIKEMRNLEDQLKDRMKDLAGKSKAMKKLLQNLNADPKKAGPQELKDLEDALAKGQWTSAVEQ